MLALGTVDKDSDGNSEPVVTPYNVATVGWDPLRVKVSLFAHVDIGLTFFIRFRISIDQEREVRGHEFLFL